LKTRLLRAFLANSCLSIEGGSSAIFGCSQWYPRQSKYEQQPHALNMVRILMARQNDGIMARDCWPATSMKFEFAVPVRYYIKIQHVQQFCCLLHISSMKSNL
jgi:hypothetical protein